MTRLSHCRQILPLVLFFFCHNSFSATCHIPQKLMFRPTALSYQDNKLYVLGRAYETFYVIHLKNCQTQLIAGGEKNGFVSPLGLANNSVKGQWVVLDSGTGMINIQNGKTKGMIGKKMPDMLSTVSPLLSDPNAFIAVGDRTVYKVNFSNGETTLISDAKKGRGPLMQDLRSVATVNDKIFALDYHQKKIYEINVNNGNRHIFADLKQFTKNNIQSLQPFGIAASDTSVFVSDPEAKQIIRIDQKTGAASVLNSNDTQKEHPMVAPIGMNYDLKNNVLYVSDFGKNAIYALPIEKNKTEAIRETVALMKRKDGYPNDMIFPVDLVLNHDGDILVGDQHAASVFKLNPKTKEFTLFSAANKGSGPIMLEGNAVNSFTDHSILMTDTSLTRVYEIDGQGNRRVFSPADNHVPGDPIWMTKGLKDLWYVASGGDSTVYQFRFNVKKRTVHSTVISDNQRYGKGPHLYNVLGIAWDTQNNQLIIANQGPNELLWVDPKNGNRTLLSGKNKGSGAPFKYVAGLAYANPDSVYVADSFRPAIVRVDLKTGNRSIVSGMNDSGAMVGFGPMFQSVASIILSPNKDIAYVTDAHGAAVYEVTLKTGDRELLKKSDV